MLVQRKGAKDSTYADNDCRTDSACPAAEMFVQLSEVFVQSFGVKDSMYADNGCRADSACSAAGMQKYTKKQMC